MEAIVKYNYLANEPDELTLRKGDIIKEIKVMVGGWWEGTLRDKRGMFPDNFVKVLDSSSSGGTSTIETVSSTKPEEVTLRNGGSGRKWCKVLFSYEPCKEDELTLKPQDSIEYLGEEEDGWWRGRLRGRIGVFPSNFVSPPSYEEEDKHKLKDKKEYCRVLFPYESAKEDELTLVEGEIITLLSRDVPDPGWWKGELKGQIGLFPDNFVEVIGIKSDHQDPEQRHEANQSTTKSVAKHAHQLKKSEKAHVRKSLDVRNTHADHFSNVETTKKMISTSSSVSSTSPLSGIGGDGGEKKTIVTNRKENDSKTNLKHVVSDAGSNNGNGNTNVGLEEELDGVERGEGAPLSHLTASRAKAPRRRLPSSQHLRHHATGTTPNATTIVSTTMNTVVEDNLSNGNTEETLESLRDDESEKLSVKARKKAPWVEELRINQLERRKVLSTDCTDRPEIRKERIFSRLKVSSNTLDTVIKQEVDGEDSKQREKERKSDTAVYTDHGTVTTPGTLAFVPYHLYSQLLERVAMLEEKQALLQQTVRQLSEQLVPLMANASINNKV